MGGVKQMRWEGPEWVVQWVLVGRVKTPSDSRIPNQSMP